MNFIKRACSIVLAVIMVVTVFAVVIYAGASAESPEATVSFSLSAAQKTVAENGNVTVNVTLSGAGAYGLQFALSYNKDLFKPTAVTTALSSESFGFMSNLNYAEDKVYAMVYGSSEIPLGSKGTVVVATVTFKSLGSTVGAETDLDLSEVVISDSNGNSYDPSCITTTSGEIRAFPAGADQLALPGKMLILGSDVTLVYLVDSKFEKSYSDLYVSYKLGSRVQTVTAEEDKYSGYLQFKFKNINPYEYAQDISATLYGKYNGVEYQSVTKKYSVVDYCASSFTDNASDKINKLMADMLVYGASIQKYILAANGIDSGALCTSDKRVTSYVEKYYTKTDPTPQNDRNNKQKECDTRTLFWSAATLSLGTAVSPQFIFRTTENLNDVSIKVYGTDGTLYKTYTKKDFVYYGVVSGNDCYIIDFSMFGVSFMRHPIDVVAYKNGVEISRTYRYSIESYAYSVVTNPSANSPELVRACYDMVKYGRSAEEYANN